MPKLKEDYTKQEKINGVVYNMSPSANYRHSIVNGNIYGKLREGLKGSLCLEMCIRDRSDSIAIVALVPTDYFAFLIYEASRLALFARCFLDK